MPHCIICDQWMDRWSDDPCFECASVIQDTIDEDCERSRTDDTSVVALIEVTDICELGIVLSISDEAIDEED